MSGGVGPTVLGLETSCDETGVGIVRGQEILAHLVCSSVQEYVRFGGVIPEIASRAHVDALIPTVERALCTSGLGWADVDAIAVTVGPGLAGALMVGVCGAKALALAAGKPLYAVNHLVAHIAAAGLDSTVAHYVNRGGSRMRVGALLISGGHTEILRLRSHTGWSLVEGVEKLGGTVDDAAGEAFDKVGRMLGLPYPAGPALDHLARQGDPGAVAFPRALSAPALVGSAQEPGRHRYDVSFSGLKTAVARYVEKLEDDGRRVPIADIAAAFQEALVESVVSKTMMACRDKGLGVLLVGGGVAANSRLREVLQEEAGAVGVQVLIPDRSLCTDNGAMVAGLGEQLVQAGVAPSALHVAPVPSLPASTVLVTPG